MTIAQAQYTSSGSINAVIDGVALSIPDDMGNRDRQKLAAWVADGNTIAAYVPPVKSPAEQAEEARLAGFAFDAGQIDLLARLKTATPAQIDTWLNNNVTTLAQVRTVFGAILKRMALRM